MTAQDGVRTRRDDPGALSSLFSVVARRLSDGQLAIITSIGLIGTTIVGLYATSLWRVGLVFVVLAAYGARGIFDRSEAPRLIAPAARRLTMLVGTLAAFVLLFSTIEFALLNLRH